MDTDKDHQHKAFLEKFGLYAPIKQLSYAPNRSSKRKAEKEYISMFNQLYGIELSFYSSIFEKDTSSYEDIYRNHLTWWNDTCKYIVRKQKPAFWGVDLKYFAEEFRPRENERV